MQTRVQRTSAKNRRGAKRGVHDIVERSRTQANQHKQIASSVSNRVNDSEQREAGADEGAEARATSPRDPLANLFGGCGSGSDRAQ